MISDVAVKMSKQLSSYTLLNEKTPLLRRYFHSSVSIYTLSWMIYGGGLMLIYGDENDPNPFLQHGYKYKAYFLSLWLTALQSIYFMMYSGIDLLELYHKNDHNIHKVIHYIHSVASYLLFTVVFPLTLVVFLLFWAMYFWNRELIYPEVIDYYIPPWVNHAMHTIPVPLTVLYMITSNRNEPSKVSTLAGLVAFLGVYSYFFFSIYERDGKWIYIALHAFTPEQTWIILATTFIASICFLFLGHSLYSLLSHLKNTIKSLFQVK